jgi:hypothetical protein
MLSLCAVSVYSMELQIAKPSALLFRINLKDDILFFADGEKRTVENIFEDPSNANISPHSEEALYKNAISSFLKTHSITFFEKSGIYDNNLTTVKASLHCRNISKYICYELGISVKSLNNAPFGLLDEKSPLKNISSMLLSCIDDKNKDHTNIADKLINNIGFLLSFKAYLNNPSSNYQMNINIYNNGNGFKGYGIEGSGTLIRISYDPSDKYYSIFSLGLFLKFIDFKNIIEEKKSN